MSPCNVVILITTDCTMDPSLKCNNLLWLLIDAVKAIKVLERSHVHQKPEIS